MNYIRPTENIFEDAKFTDKKHFLSREIQKILGSNAAWAAVSLTTLGLVKKPNQQT